ncbi:MAG: hypothetical protein KGM47_00865 [Acidobacteriota bacterium]|nr:hypothetical protein [Acidobacteriota bacterium]
MARVSGLCPCCGAGISPVDVSTRAFQCSRCSAWLRVSYAQSLLRVLVLMLVAGIAAYRLGFRGVPFILVYLAAFCTLFLPVYAILDRVLPWRPERTVPPWGGLGLTGANVRQPGPEPPAADEEQPEGGKRPGDEAPAARGDDGRPAAP